MIRSDWQRTSFKLGHCLLDAQELALAFSEDVDGSKADAVALCHAQRTAMQTWEAFIVVSTAAAMNPGPRAISALSLAMGQLAASLAEWTKLSDSMPANDPAEALPVVKEAEVFLKSSSALQEYHRKNVRDALDLLTSGTELLEAVAGGGEAGTSWKKDLSDTATFLEVVAGSKALLQNITIMTQRLQDVKEAGTSWQQ